MMTQTTEASEYLAKKTRSFHEADDNYKPKDQIYKDNSQFSKNTGQSTKNSSSQKSGSTSTKVTDTICEEESEIYPNTQNNFENNQSKSENTNSKFKQKNSFIQNPSSPENKPKMYENTKTNLKHKDLKESSASTRSFDNISQNKDVLRQERRPSTAPAIPKDLETEAYYAETRNALGRTKLDNALFPKDPSLQPNMTSLFTDTINASPEKEPGLLPNNEAKNERSSLHDQLDSIDNFLNNEDFDQAEHSSFSSGIRNSSASLPPDTSAFPQIPTKEALETYRQNAKKSHDPEVQLDFAKYLIETAALVLENHGDHVDPQTARKLHNTLITEALKWIKRLSSQGIGLGKGAYPDAQFFLANCYNNGSLGLPVDHDKAFNLYVQASKQNHPAATYRTGVCYEFGAGTKRDHHRALQFFRKAAALGDTAAMFKVGMVLLKGGLGQQSNPREGITWLKRAAASADEENPHALHELASCYEKGGIPSIIADASYARELYTQAAQLGYVHSQFKMGVCYEQGLLTCPVDPRRSIAWFTRGAEQGDPECELALSGWYLTGSEGVLKQSDTEAYLWARKAAEKGLAKAEYAVGYYSEVGIGAKQDLDEARRWFMRAAAQGNKRAMERLTELKKLGSNRRNGAKSKEDGSCIIS